MGEELRMRRVFLVELVVVAIDRVNGESGLTLLGQGSVYFLCCHR